MAHTCTAGVPACGAPASERLRGDWLCAACYSFLVLQEQQGDRAGRGAPGPCPTCGRARTWRYEGGSRKARLAAEPRAVCLHCDGPALAGAVED